MSISPYATCVSAVCTTNFGLVPGFYETKPYLAIKSSSGASQANNPDLISAAACLTSRTSCKYAAGHYGLVLVGSQQGNAMQAHKCLNDVTGSTDFYQQRANGQIYIFANGEKAMESLNTALASAPTKAPPTKAPTPKGGEALVGS